MKHTEKNIQLLVVEKIKLNGEGDHDWIDSLIFQLDCYLLLVEKKMSKNMVEGD